MLKFTVMKDRLLQFLNQKQLSATHLADEIGVQRSSVSHVLSGRNNPSYDFIYKILKRYDNLSADWLISGKGEMYRKNAQEKSAVTAQHQQGDLFSNVQDTPVTKAKEEDIPVYGRSEKSEVNPIDQGKATETNKKLEQVILIYDDGSFRAYYPF